MTKATKNSHELKDVELDQVQGAGTKGLLGDQIGVRRDGNKLTPETKTLERVHEDE